MKALQECIVNIIFREQGMYSLVSNWHVHIKLKIIFNIFSDFLPESKKKHQKMFEKTLLF